MKLSRLRQDIADGYGFIMVNKEVVARFERKEAEELLADIDAEIAKAREGSNIDRRVSSLAGGLDEVEMRLSALEASEVELREHCQGNVPMRVFNGLRERVDSLSSGMSILENATTRELRALAERVMALEASPHIEAPPLGDKRREPTDEDDAYKAWRLEPWPDGVGFKGAGIQNEYAFRAGFRAGRK